MNNLYSDQFLFLSSMMGKTDASFCVRRGNGATMVQLGALLAAREDQLEKARKSEPQFFLPPDEETTLKMLSKEVQTVHEGLGEEVMVALNLGVFDLKVGAEAGRLWRKAGGDFLELNVHGNWNNASEEGFLKGLALPSYRKRLKQWSKKLVKAGPPLIVKFHSQMEVDFSTLLSDLEKIDISGFHFDIRRPKGGPNLDFAERMIKESKGFSLFSGHIRRPHHARKLFNLGATGIGFAQPVLEKKDFISRMAKELRVPNH